MPRKLRSWVDGFIRFTEDIGSAPLFCKWAGIFALASTLERKVWIMNTRGRLFPNIYVFLVGPASAGKSQALSFSQQFLQVLSGDNTDTLHLAPSSVTKASLIDSLSEATRKIIRPQDRSEPVVDFNSLTVISSELGVLVPSYESDFMHALTDLWDCKSYSEHRRTRDLRIRIDNVQLNMLAATTTSYLNTLLPPGAWDQGFISRTLLIYSGPAKFTSIFTPTNPQPGLEDALNEDLATIFNLYGEMKYEPETINMIEEWARGGGQPVPNHPRLMTYNSRRLPNLLKLTMIASVSTSNDLIIKPEHFAEALDWLTEAEAAMPEIFKDMNSGGNLQVIEEAYHWLFEAHVKAKGEPILEYRLWNYLSARVPSYSITSIVEAMERGQIIEKRLTPAGNAYVPRKKEAI